MVGVDFLGSFLRLFFGNTFVVIMIDRFIRWFEFIAVSDVMVETVVDVVVDGLVVYYGCLEKILSDRGL